MSAPIPSHPHDLRILAHEQQYGNSTLEAMTIKEVDDAVFSRVRKVESSLVTAAEAHAVEVRGDIDAAIALGLAFDDEVRQPLRSGAHPEAVAKRFEALRRDAETAMASLARAEAEAAWRNQMLNDPYEHWQGLLERYPVLRPAIAN